MWARVDHGTLHIGLIIYNLILRYMYIDCIRNIKYTNLSDSCYLCLLSGPGGPSPPLDLGETELASAGDLLAASPLLMKFSKE